MRIRTILVAGLFWLAVFDARAQQGRPDFGKADALIDAAIAAKNCPGAVLLVGRKAGVVYQRAYGNRAVEPAVEAMTTETVFDLASLTKPVATATSVLILIDRGKVDPTKTVATYLPEFGRNGKEVITVEQLLLHRGGLIPDNDEKDYADGPEKAWERICELKPIYKPGERFAYSDLSFIVLGKLVERVDGRTLDRFAAEEIFAPLGMTDTGFKPAEALRARCAPTERRNGQWIRGEVHDPRSYRMGGVAGHAGLFSTAADLARFCRMILNGGELDGKRILSAKAIEMIQTPRKLPGGATRSYGYDVRTGYSQPLGHRFPPYKSFGHTGFTGTAFWIDPADDAFFILLTNSVHPDGKGKVLGLRRVVSTAVATALLGPAPDGQVLSGLDMMVEQGFAPLRKRHVAVITNQTGRDRDGNRLIDLLARERDVHVVCLFSPEHGLYGNVDEKVGHGVDAKTGFKVWSLYGPTRRPTDEMLEGVDTMLFDIQDIGTRFYTYPATLGYCMEEAAKRKIKVIVLDRPNPIGAMGVHGMIAEKKFLGFTAYGPLPLVHGMTIGELARLFNGEYGIGCDLSVVECVNYRREMWWDQTGLMWTNPSPNMRNLTQATIYPAIGMLEAANLSVGRGTDQPFEFFGAPWVDDNRLATELNDANLPGLRFVPIEFTPVSSKFKDQACQGCYVVVTDRTKVQPGRTGLTIAWELKKLFGDAFQIDAVSRLMQNEAVLAALKATDDPAKLPAMWRDDLAGFRAVREKYLIYK
ncbi:MAG TPA: exo-beta-N-acetylmuramidase NamZ domain-containing protein [Tepidisphaeraceae bacterium]